MDNQQSAEELGQRRMPCWQSKITDRTVWLKLMWVCVCVLACSSTTSHGGELVINKILANSSVAVLPERIAPVDWAELRNRSDQELDISGMGLSDRLDLPDRWVFPPGSIVRAREAIIVIFTDSIPPSTSPVPYMNTGFGLSAGGDVLLLSSVSGGLWTTEDSVGFGFQAQDWPIGRVPDGTGSWQLVAFAPKELNRAVALGYPSALRINEWMADPSSGDDWFELCNLAAAPLAVGGLYLSDDRKLPTRHRIPDLSFIGTGEYGFALFVADGDVSKGARHVNFKLGKRGSPILLTAADG
ncbi:MAG: lamin tail domain-containing protein, partial [Verrucomicrobia bacterium]|nr:lamin tail domain-containing protein [Verrucomicrobiota bacterium]